MQTSMWISSSDRNPAEKTIRLRRAKPCSHFWRDQGGTEPMIMILKGTNNGCQNRRISTLNSFKRRWFHLKVFKDHADLASEGSPLYRLTSR